MLRTVLPVLVLSLMASFASANGGPALRTTQHGSAVGRAWKASLTLKPGAVVTFHEPFGARAVHIVRRERLHLVSNGGQAHLEAHLTGNGDPLRMFPVAAVSLSYQGHLGKAVHLDRDSFISPSALRTRLSGFEGKLGAARVYAPSEAAPLFEASTPPSVEGPAKVRTLGSP